MRAKAGENAISIIISISELTDMPGRSFMQAARFPLEKYVPSDTIYDSIPMMASSTVMVINGCRAAASLQQQDKEYRRVRPR